MHFQVRVRVFNCQQILTFFTFLLPTQQVRQCHEKRIPRVTLHHRWRLERHHRQERYEDEIRRRQPRRLRHHRQRRPPLSFRQRAPLLRGQHDLPY